MSLKNIINFAKSPYDFVKENPDSNLKYLLILVGWTFQGIFYADATERLFKIICDILLICLFFTLFTFLFSFPLSLIAAILLGHTINWLINVGIWCSLRGKYGIHINGVGLSDKELFFKNFLYRIQRTPGIQSVLIYGSYARGEAKPNSDIDIRIIRRPGVVYAIEVCFFGLSERVRALFNKIPLDLCVIDNLDHLKKMNEDEIPEIIFDPDNLLKSKKMMK